MIIGVFYMFALCRFLSLDWNSGEKKTYWERNLLRHDDFLPWTHFLIQKPPLFQPIDWIWLDFTGWCNEWLAWIGWLVFRVTNSLLNGIMIMIIPATKSPLRKPGFLFLYLIVLFLPGFIPLHSPSCYLRKQ